jgi:PAS domain S-box-containing protein
VWQETVVENMGEGAYILDADNVLQYVNFRLSDLDADSAEWLGRPVSHLATMGVLSESAVDRIETAADQVRAGEIDSSRLEITSPIVAEDRTLELRLTAADADRDLVIGTTRDITDRKREEEKRREIIGRVTDAVVEVDADWAFTLVNDQAEALYGRSKSELLGEDFWEVFDGARGTRFETEYRTAMTERTTTSFTEYYDGLDAWFTVHVYPNDDGGLAFYFRDVTERKERMRELEIAKSRYEALADNFPNGAVFYFDDDKRYQIVSGMGFDPIDTSPSDLIGNKPSAVEPYSEEESSRIARLMQKTLDGNQEIVELPPYEGHIYEIRSAPIRDDDGDVVAGLYISQDITEKRRRKQELEARNERLEEFAQIVSHDLKNPLSVARANIEMARVDFEFEQLDKIEAAIQRCNRIIEDVLTLASDGTDIRDVEPVALDSVASDCWDTVATADATLDIETNRTIRADRSRLRQVLSNLMRNAVLHGSSDVTVRLGATAEGFYVADSGTGIPDDERGDIFDSGYTTSSEGTGFGLSIVSQVVDGHGWELTLTESRSGGARFEITGVEFDE